MKSIARRASLHAPLFALVLTAAAPHARAQDRATAQQLFEEGKALMAKKQFAEACPKFEGATKLVATSGVRLNLADCYEQSGRYASAWAAFDDAAAAAERMGDGAAAREADVGKKRVAPRRSFLVIAASVSAEVGGLEIRRDGVVIPSIVWGTGTPVDPGEHVVEATAPGHKPWTTKVQVGGPGGHATATIPVLELASPGGDAPAAAAPAPEKRAPDSPGDKGPTKPSGGTQRTLAYVAGGVGVLGVAAGTFFAIRSHGNRTDAESLCPGGTCRATDPNQLASLRSQVESLDADATSAGRSAVIAYGVGAAGLITGVTLFVLSSKSSSTATSSPSIQPWIGMQSAGVLGSF